MTMRSDLTEITPFDTDEECNGTIDDCVSQLQSAATDLFASLVLRAHIAGGDLDRPSNPQTASPHGEGRTAPGRLSRRSSTFDATLEEIDGQLERMNRHLAPSPEPTRTAPKTVPRERAAAMNETDRTLARRPATRGTSRSLQQAKGVDHG